MPPAVQNVPVHRQQDSEYPRSTDAINAVGGVGIVNSDGSMFETQYNRDSTGRGSGMIGQNYAGDLAEYSGYDWFDICDYFYSNSDKSDGDIEKFEYDMNSQYAF